MKPLNYDSLIKKLFDFSYQTISTINECKCQKTDYFSWHEDIDGEQFELTNGFGDKDQHYQLSFTISKKEYQEYNNLCIRATTDDVDMWDLNNPQILIVINGKVIRAFDTNHQVVELPIDGEEQWKVDFNIYTNTKRPDVFLDIELIEQNPLVSSFFYQIKSLRETCELLPDKSYEKIKLEKLLDKALRKIDFKYVDTKKVIDSIIQAKEQFDYELDTIKVDSPDIVEYVVGHTHIDISWLWGIQQTKEKAVRSFSNAIYLLKKYPEMKFMSSQPILYEMVKEKEPGMFEEIKLMVEAGRWEIEGAMYLESDVNLPAGESLIRQIMYGKEFIKEEFNKESQILWLPDVFGYTASLPQILAKTQTPYFFTSKIDWNETNRLPNDTFYWKGIDGTEILTHFLTTSDFHPENKKGTTYNGRLNASQILGTWGRYQNKHLSNKVIQVYGFGDGGGGPTDEMLENYNFFKKGISGMPKTIQKFPSEFFHDLQVDIQGKFIPKWTGELYLETHRGVLTTGSELKKINRQIETNMHNVETLEVFLSCLTNEFDYSQVKKAWKNIFINQFHDILPGTSVEEVFVETYNRYEESAALIDKVKQDLIEKISAQFNLKANNLLINPMPFDRDVLVTGNNKETVIENISAYGIKVQSNINTSSKEPLSEIKDNIIETPFYILELDNCGQIIRLFDKYLDFEVIEEGEKGNVFCLYEDYPRDFDAWNIDKETLNKEITIDETAQLTVVENSSIRTKLVIEKKILNSTIKQSIILYKHTKRIDFDTTVDWVELELLLRVKFPVNIVSNKGVYDIQFGNIERNNYENTSWDEAKFEVCAHKWCDLSEQAYGVSILNDGKYGHQISENNMYLSLLRGTKYPAKNIDTGIHQFTYSLYPHEGDFREGNVYKEAYDLNNKPIISEERTQFGELTDWRLFNLDKTNIVCETVKLSEDGAGFVLRLFESYGQTTESIINFGVGSVSIFECDMLENQLSEVQPIETNVYRTKFKPYEIKTLKIYMN